MSTEANYSPTSAQPIEIDMEKNPDVAGEQDIGSHGSSRSSGQVVEIENDATAIPESMVSNKFLQWANNLVRNTGAEARGIERVDEALRTAKVALSQYVKMAFVWFSTNLTANILTIGVMGPTTFGLGGIDSMMCCLFGTTFGSVVTCYMATYGPISGCRSLVAARFTMGWWATKLCVVLAIVVMLGYGLVNAITTGLIFSAVSGGTLSTIVGIIVLGLIVWVISVFGIKYMHYYERYAFVPQVCVLFVLIGASAPYMDVGTKSMLAGKALIGARISYFFTCASGPMGWAPFIADSFCYYSPKTKRWGIWSATCVGFVASKIFVQFIGIGLGTGIATKAEWEDGFSSLGVGGLLMAAYDPLGAFGKFCVVIMGLGMAANLVPGNYSIAFCAQNLSEHTAKLPRVFWNTVATIIYVVVAIPGRNFLLTIFSNFLPLIGYWVFIWIILTAQEEWLFRRRRNPEQPYDWSAWNNPSKLPLGLAAFAAFLIGWAGAILCMNQVYYIGPIAKLAGPADIGVPIGGAWAALVYPPLRYMELKRFGR
ncbi:hypothetical protein FE257_008825 [Aspergillus nanangensis]|uniref:Uncharacterized protein n=1 Tax=Aspergillus nanangensis TaxID=2582783 RepID=A0AAD4CKS0_ASPNN|nr:hypothetical protein FE257_008825 [Aspergillus nanangensis]